MKYNTRKRVPWRIIKKTAACAGLLLAAVGFSGCAEARETMMQMRQELRQEIALDESKEEIQNPNEVQESALQVPSIDEIANRIEEDDIRIEETYEPVQTMGQPVSEITVALYFADASGVNLVKTEKSIPKVEGMARATIESLLEGPAQESGFTSAIPEGTQLLDINVRQTEKKCIVDFSHEFGTALEDTANTAGALESIARTLCQFDSIEEVEFRVEGQTVRTIRLK